MKTNELRIGNLVYVTDNLTNLIFKEITPINIHNLMHLTGWDKSPIDIEFEPIPLTEEWLVKFGFKPLVKDWQIKGLILHTRKRGFVVNKKIPIVKYVHQLQNLYFALTGEELTLKQTDNI